MPNLDDLYAAFARVPRPRSIDYCECCLTAEEARAVVADVPLRTLPAPVLQPYAANVMFTAGGVDDFRYFLPRFLEIACGEGFPWPDPESAVGRLRFAGWTGWQADERDAVREFLFGWWKRTLAGDPAADIVLCAIGNAEDDLGPYLDEWVAALGRPADRAAAVAQLQELLENRLANPFWKDRAEQAAQVRAWLSSAPLQVALYGAFEDADDEETLQALADIDDLTRR